MAPERKTALMLTAAVCCAALAAWYLMRPPSDDPQIRSALSRVTTDFRKIIVLMDGADALGDAGLQARCRATGRRIFFDKQQAIAEVGLRLRQGPDRVEVGRQILRYVTGSELRDADRLAFLDLLDELAELQPGEAPLKALDELRSIQAVYREEVNRIFSQLGTRGGEEVRREKWETYLGFLRGTTTRDQILTEFGAEELTDIGEAPSTRGGSAAASNEIFGSDFAPKTVALTFDDGPHPKYTEQVTALLQKYGIRACFFQLGQNLAATDGKLLKGNAEITRRLLAAGHSLANHSYSHRMLSKLTEADRASEISKTNALLEQVSGQKPVLFRPPYGARNQKVLADVTGAGLRNVMWTIDSQDWADPIPESIALRVLNALKKDQKGIILFHDIHKQSVLALPAVVEELQRQQYTFLSWDKGAFVKSGPPVGAPGRSEEAAQPTVISSTTDPAFKPYGQSWAVIIGINDYPNWPKLKYSVNDANGMEDELVRKFGFQRENIIKLIDGQATRQRILQVLGDELSNPEKVKRDDRVFFFFAGHGATRTMPDGRQIGFIVPVDADRANYYSTAISMNSIREACDLIAAKHIYFVMDSCYSGLALTRGAGSFARDRSYLEEVSRRTARQILTAGGAEQQVSDEGPSGHSVFTWALLQGLDGKADLDGNGVITASELGAYVSPVVSSFSKQTPAVGNFPGSEGGEFLFELRPEALTSSTEQLEGKSLALNSRLVSLEKMIAARQTELLKLQQSIQAEAAKLKQMAAPASAQAAAIPAVPPAKKPTQARAYDLDRTALQLYREKKYDEAAKALEQAVQLKPGDATLRNNLSYVYFRMGRLEDARTGLLKTLELDPRRKEAHANLADVYAHLGRKAEARQHYEEYLRIAPGSSKADEVRRALALLN